MKRPTPEAGGGSRKGKRGKRREVLEKKNAIRGLINAASSLEDPLSDFAALRNFNENGLSVYLESGRGDKLSAPMKQYIRELLRSNMAGAFGPEWPVEEKVKHREMVSPEARYIFVHERRDGSGNEPSHIWCMERKGTVAGFVHYRFILEEEEVPVLYVYEIQLESRVRGKGLGKFLMQVIEQVARKSQMGAMMLTVQKSNTFAMNFYTKKMRYTISSTSPSRADPNNGSKKSYEILCKAFDPEVKSLLEGG